MRCREKVVTVVIFGQIRAVCNPGPQPPRSA